jgi:hypothetical protein
MGQIERLSMIAAIKRERTGLLMELLLTKIKVDRAYRAACHLFAAMSVIALMGNKYAGCWSREPRRDRSEKAIADLA